MPLVILFHSLYEGALPVGVPGGVDGGGDARTQKYRQLSEFARRGRSVGNKGRIAQHSIASGATFEVGDNTDS